MAYGTHTDVAALARTWTDNGAFSTTTNPTQAQVITWIDEVSVLADIALANEGFVVPVVEAEVIKALTVKVAALVADLCHLAHAKGRLFSDRIQSSADDVMTVISKDLASWVKRNAIGLEAMGVPRITAMDSQSDFSVQLNRML